MNSSEVDALRVEQVWAIILATISAIVTVVLIGATILDHWYYAPAAAVWAAITYFFITVAEGKP